MKVSHVSLKPLDATSRRQRLGSTRDDFFQSVVGEAPVFFLEETGTKIDVGHWLAKRKVWISIVEGEVILFAIGRRPVVERIGFEDLNESRYNHVTGELVLSPAWTLTVRELDLPPLAAREVLAQINHGDHDDGLA